MAVLPAMAGKLRDLTGSPVTPISFAVAAIICAVLFLIAFQILKRPQHVIAERRFV